MKRTKQNLSTGFKHIKEKDFKYAVELWMGIILIIGLAWLFVAFRVGANSFIKSLIIASTIVAEIAIAVNVNRISKAYQIMNRKI